MNYKIYKLDDSGHFQTFDGILFSELNAYLDSCDKVVFKYWKKQWAEDKFHRSISKIFSATVLKDIRNMNSLMNPNEKYSIEDKLFQHYNIYYSKLVELLVGQKDEHEKFLLVTQDEFFRSKFNYDGAAMTFNQIQKRTQSFFNRFKLERMPIMYCLVFLDLPNISVEMKHIISNKKTHIELKFHE